MDTPLVYLILGITGSGRRGVLLDLIQDGIGKDEQVLYFRPAGESPSEYDAQLEALPNLNVVEWSLDDAKVRHGKINAAPGKIFFIAPGNSDPSDVAEALKTWIERNNCELGRVITVLHCEFLSKHAEAEAWFRACIHFSDIVLMNRRETIDQKWVKDFEDSYRKACYPCLFDLVKKDRVKNPAAVLEPEARRLSLYFDKLIPIEEDEFEEDAPEDTQPDRYILRSESGQRMHPIPSIQQFLG